MSAAGRGKRLGGAFDFFPTPMWTVRRLLEAWQPKPGVWFEPGGGHGSIIRATNEFLDVSGDWMTVDIREGARQHLEPLVKPEHLRIADLLVDENFDDAFVARLASATAAIGNPPFEYAEQFLIRTFELCPNADVALLLRTGFFEGEDRSDFLRSCCPDVYALPQRPSFLGTGNDMASYSWMVWPAHAGRRSFGRFRVLNATPLAERKAG